MSDFKVGDHVRVGAARRRDVTWRVTEVVGRIVVAVNGSRDGEIRYDAEKLEHVNPGEGVPTVGPSPEAAPMRQAYEPPWSASLPAEIRDSTIVRPGAGEPIEAVLKRFKKAVERSGVLHEFREHRYFVSPGQRRRLKSRHARVRRAAEDASQLARSRNF